MELENETMVALHTNDTCTIREFAPCHEKCPVASCQFVKYTHNQVRASVLQWQSINVVSLHS